MFVCLIVVVCARLCEGSVVIFRSCFEYTVVHATDVAPQSHTHLLVIIVKAICSCCLLLLLRGRE